MIENLNRLSILTFLLFLFQTPRLGAQGSSPIRTYGTVAYNQVNARVDSTLGRNISLQARIGRETTLDLTEEFTIALVFHVLYNDETDRVTAAQVESQIEALNRDFSGAAKPINDPDDPSGHYRELVTDSRIRFCLAANDPYGFSTSGVNLRQINGLPLGNLELRGELTGLPAWNPKKYLNVWIMPLSEDKAGYAQYPGGNNATDGIVIDSRLVGEGGITAPPYHLGKTLTHLVGNYLGLQPLWGHSRCEDDGVADTPVHNAPNVGDPGLGHTSLCDGYPTEMTMNFMDNTDDEQQYLFTEGQIKRMRAMLSTPSLRGGLLKTEVQCGRYLSPLIPTPYLRPAAPRKWEP